MRRQDISDAIPEILDRLVGNIAGQGDAALDREAQANIDNFEAVCAWVEGKLIDAERYAVSPYYSMADTGRMTIEAAEGLIYLIREELGK